jgi:hypothetical protein
VAASWSRSSQLHSLSPERDVDPQCVDEIELKRDRDALGRLLEAARPSLDQIFELVGHAGCSVVMASPTEMHQVAAEPQPNREIQIRFTKPDPAWVDGLESGE